MSHQWLFTKDGLEAGPVPTSQLRAMYDSGQLAETDLVRPADEPGAMAQTLGDVLAMEPPAPPFSPTTITATTGDDPIPPGSPKSNPGDPLGTRDWLKEKWDLLTANASLTAQRGVLQARRFRIANSVLPTAYLALGKAVRDEGRYRDEFTELYQELDDLVDEIAQLEPAESRATKVEFPSMIDQLRGLATKLAGIPQREMLASHARGLLRELGRKAYDAHAEEAGPEPLVADVRQARTRLEEIDGELGRLDEEEVEAGRQSYDSARQALKKLVDTGAALAAEVPRAWSRARAKAEANQAEAARRDEHPDNKPKI